MSKIKVLIIDDHEIVRKGLRSFLELIDDFEIAGEGTNGHEAVELERKLKPDVVLLDLMMPELDGIEAARRIKANNPDAGILILSSFSDEDHVIPAIQAGATGYVLKDISPEDLEDAVRKTAQGKTLLHPDIAARLMRNVQNPKSGPEEMDRRLKDLTEREMEVLILIGRGMSNKEAADELSISLTTVKTHVSNILGKLALYDRTQAAIFALKNNLVPEGR